MRERRWWARRWTAAIIALLGLVLVAYYVYCCIIWSGTTVILVRHAEKGPGSGNVSLTTEGGTRAQNLASIASEKGVIAVYATEFCRTAQTAQPSAIQLGLTLQIKEFSGGLPGIADEDCDPDITVPVSFIQTQANYYEELADRVLSEHRNRTVLIVGHSNTVPLLVEELGADSLCPTYFGLTPQGNCLIPDNQFNNLLTVTVSRFSIFNQPQVTREQYGAPN